MSTPQPIGFSIWFRRARLVLFVAIVSMIVFYISSGEAPTPEKIELLLNGLRDSPVLLPVLLMVFLLMSSVGVPQFVLIAATILTFGPVAGSIYSWLGTMASASIHFIIARVIGAEPVRKVSGKLMQRVSGLIGQKGFWTSLLVRNLPTGPFVLVNMALGVSRARTLAFLAGTALGILPKIIALALFAESLRSMLQQRDWFYTGLFLLMGLGFALVIFWLVKWFERTRNG